MKWQEMMETAFSPVGYWEFNFIALSTAERKLVNYLNDVLQLFSLTYG